MKVIDIHGHVMLPETFGKAGKYGPDFWVEGESFMLRIGEHVQHMKLPEESRELARTDPEQLLKDTIGDAAKRVRQMDEKGITVMGVTISPLFYLYWAEPEIGIEFAAIQNDALADHCSSQPDRLFFMPTLPLQDIEASVEELDRAVKLGGKAVNMAGGSIAGRELDDEAFFPLYEKVVEHDVPIFSHPYPEPLAKSGETTDDYNLSWVLGYLQQETMAFTRLIYGGVLDVFPDLKVCIAHGGGYVPYQLGRLDAFARYMPGVRAARPVYDYMKNFYFDMLVHDARGRRFLVDVVGSNNLLFGSNFGSPQDQGGLWLLEDIGLSEEDLAKVSHGNAARLFHLDVG